MRLAGSDLRSWEQVFAARGLVDLAPESLGSDFRYRAGVDINTIHAWLGHVSLNTTKMYAEVDLEVKANALATCEVKSPQPDKHWKNDVGSVAAPAGYLNRLCGASEGPTAL